MTNWFFIFWLLSSNLFCNVSGKWNKFKTQTGIIYQTFYLTTTVQIFIHCTMTCHLEEPCGAVNYNTISSECQLIDKQDVGMQADGNMDGIWIVTTKDIKPGIGNSCSEDSDCWDVNSLCIDNKCICAHTARYNSTTDSCDMECNAYADDFVQITERAITLYNIEVIHSLTLEQCKNKCIEAGIACGSIDYKPTVCSLNKVTYQQIGEADPTAVRDTSPLGSDEENLHLYTRHC